VLRFIAEASVPCAWLCANNTHGVQEEATQVEHRLRELNRTRLQLERHAEQATAQQGELEAELAARVAGMPQALQQRFGELQGEVRLVCSCAKSCPVRGNGSMCGEVGKVGRLVPGMLAKG
jgi:hypothetical protein